MSDASVFEVVGTVSDVPEGELLAVRSSAGDEICVFNDRGRIGAVQGTCTHAEFPMSDGQLRGDGTIECVWHGARFDCWSGAVRNGPAVDPLLCYEVRVANGKILVGLRMT